MDMTKFKFMESVRQQISDELPNIKACFHRANPLIGQQFDDIIFSALERRLNTISVRSSFVFWAYQYLEEDAQRQQLPFRAIPKEHLVKLAFLADAAMALMYIHNQVYDNKFGVCDTRSIGNNLGAGNLLKDAILDEYVHLFPAEYVHLIRSKMRRAFNDVDRGQLMDKNFGFREFYKNKPCENWIENFKKEELHLINDLIIELKTQFSSCSNVLDYYFVRIYLINSSLLKSLAEILLEMTGLSYLTAISSKIISFAQLMGLYFQVVNDNTDFVLDVDNNNKKATDVLSDLKNSTISLPILIHLNIKKKGKKRIIHQYALYRKKHPIFSAKDSELLEGQHNEILQEIIESDAMNQSTKAGKSIAEQAKAIFTNDANACAAGLLALTDIAFWNRYYYHIRKAKTAYNRGEKYYCEEHLSKKPNGNGNPVNDQDSANQPFESASNTSTATSCETVREKEMSN
ncbi:MAG TPA: polyprenyl synthetase family protein [Saprospiraceae bacterium]|nr:polyprenyl synthetase family protein [Saprospiraceae bacterium]HMQ82823.1 polyprenyl synthetase family protein [Saprospiraceae bacterium]